MKTKQIKSGIFAIIFLCCLYGIYHVLFGISWPSKVSLCSDVVEFISKDDCYLLKSKDDIVRMAFQINVVTKNDVEDAIGEYLIEESYRPDVLNGYNQHYYLDQRIIDYIFPMFKYYGTYSFTYSSDDKVLIHLTLFE